MIQLHSPELLAGLLAAGVLAAIMSSLDSQVLCLGTMFTQDIVRYYGRRHTQMSERVQIRVARLFVVAILGTTFFLSIFSNSSIFNLGIWSFTGFAALFPIVVSALLWKRSTKVGVLASVLTTCTLWTHFLTQGGLDPTYTVGGTGLLPVAIILPSSVLALVLGSLVSKPPREGVLLKFFGN